MRIKLHRDFEKGYRKLKINQKLKFKERKDLFLQDEFHPLLNNHNLRGKYLGHRSINVTGDLRAIYKKIGEDIIFVALDSHSNLYG